jgi:hypothetical protein
MSEYTITTTQPFLRTAHPWDNGTLRDRLEHRSAPADTVLARLRVAMDERAAQEPSANRRARRGRHRAAR